MTRVSSAMIPMSSLADLSRAQQSLIEASRQSSAQTRASDLKGYGREAQTLVSAERLVSRTQGFIATSRELSTRMDIQDVALGRASEGVAKLKEDMFQNVGLETGVGVRAQLEEAFAVLKDAMNVNLGGRYLFGGVLNDRPPVTGTLSNLAAQPLTASIEQGAAAQTMRIEEGRTVAAGVVAEDAVSLAMGAIKRLAELDEGPNGPFGEVLTPVQKQALTDELANLSDAFDHILSVQAENGRLSKEVESGAKRQAAQLETLNNAIGGIVDVDLAEVAVRLNQAQFAYQASAGVFNTLRNLSLLNLLK
jgi:flagellar hook-associated protein 3 FlgL